MAVSKDRSDWAMLILRLAVGGYALVHGLSPLLTARGSVTMAHAMHLGEALLEMACGGFLVVGIWSVPASAALLVIIGWPLVHGWVHGARLLNDVPGIFRFLATLAAGLGGPGKWSPSN